MVLGSVQERQAALEARFPRWVPRTLDAALDAAAADFPDRPYVVTDGRSWTYREIQQWSVRFATGLVRAGVQPGDHVGLADGELPRVRRAEVRHLPGGCRVHPGQLPQPARRARLRPAPVQRRPLITMDRFRDAGLPADARRAGAGLGAGGRRRGLPPASPVFVHPDLATQARPGVTSVDELGATDEGWQPLVAARPAAPPTCSTRPGTTGDPKGVLLTHDMLLRTAYGSAFGRSLPGRSPDHLLPADVPRLRLRRGHAPGLFVGGSSCRSCLRPGRDPAGDRAASSRRRPAHPGDDARGAGGGPHR